MLLLAISKYRDITHYQNYSSPSCSKRLSRRPNSPEIYLTVGEIALLFQLFGPCVCPEGQKGTGIIR